MNMVITSILMLKDGKYMPTSMSLADGPVRQTNNIPVCGDVVYVWVNPLNGPHSEQIVCRIDHRVWTDSVHVCLAVSNASDFMDKVDI